jgi:hypothetical protein
MSSEPFDGTLDILTPPCLISDAKFNAMQMPSCQIRAQLPPRSWLSHTSRTTTVGPF